MLQIQNRTASFQTFVELVFLLCTAYPSTIAVRVAQQKVICRWSSDYLFTSRFFISAPHVLVHYQIFKRFELFHAQHIITAVRKHSSFIHRIAILYWGQLRASERIHHVRQRSSGIYKSIESLISTMEQLSTASSRMLVTDNVPDILTTLNGFVPRYKTWREENKARSQPLPYRVHFQETRRLRLWKRQLAHHKRRQIFLNWYRVEFQFIAAVVHLDPFLSYTSRRNTTVEQCLILSCIKHSDGVLITKSVPRPWLLCGFLLHPYFEFRTLRFHFLHVFFS